MLWKLIFILCRQLFETLNELIEVFFAGFPDGVELSFNTQPVLAGLVLVFFLHGVPDFIGVDGSMELTVHLKRDGLNEVGSHDDFDFRITASNWVRLPSEDLNLRQRSRLRQSRHSGRK
jgi:hypothetical protein